MKKIIIVLLICFYGVCANAQPYMLDQIVAIVGSKPIKQSDVENRYLQYRAQGYSLQGDMKCGMFEELLTEKLLMNQAEVDSLVVEPSEVEMDLNRRLEMFIRQVGSQEKLEDYFKKSIYEIKDDLRNSLYEQLLAQKMQHNITENVKITPSEVRSFYIKIPKDSVPLINGQAEVAQIVVYPPYSDEAISEVRQRLLDLRERVINGESFRTMAVMYSEDLGTARNGGELGFQSKGELDPEFAKTAWALKNKGDVSRIVVSKFGYHIIQLVDKRGDQVSCRHILMTPKPNPEAIATATGRLDTLVRLIRKDSLNWNIAAFRYSQDEATRFNGGLMINPRDNSTLFEMDQMEKDDYNAIKDMKIGEVSEPYVSKDSKGKLVYKIVKLKSQSDPHRANLKSDYTFLSDIALNEKMNRVVKDWVDEKIETSYIYIDESFKRCGLNNVNWLKQ
ncbi:MAG: peptidylprolyl isomerase [Bacteroidales bacterium]|jgi:peptidyl-prolyl cis-trans isomerase SurA|nr:peptidylprolyl isomerase [Bacteroidales bacterium]